MSIREFWQRIKPLLPNEETVSFDREGRVEGARHWEKLFLAALIVLVSTLSFGLGRLSVGEKRAGVTIEYDPELAGVSSQSKVAGASTASEQTSAAGQVVGSSKGSKYHYPHCPGAKQISEKNKIVFSSAAAAEASGYTLAANCKAR